MHKILTECVRFKDRGAVRPRRAKRTDDRPFQGMQRPHKAQGKFKLFGENLAPLYRYLEQQVGRPWDKVYSDINKRLDRRSTVMDHIFLHIEDHVAVNVFIDKRGRLVALPYRFADFGFGGAKELWWQPLFVDPRTGILRRSDSLKTWRLARKTRKAREREYPNRDLEHDHPYQRIDETTELHQLGGIWYELTFAPIPAPLTTIVEGIETVEHTIFYDVLKQETVSEGDRYAKIKRQLSKAELKKRGLKNA